jgi:hypothetical protein
MRVTLQVFWGEKGRTVSPIFRKYIPIILDAGFLDFPPVFGLQIGLLPKPFI